MMACVPSQAFVVAPAYKILPNKASTAQLVAAKPSADPAKAKALVENFTSQAIDFLSNKKLSQETKEAKFKAILTRDFHLDTVARFAIGKYWRTMSSAEKAEYTTLFKDMIIRVYSARFNDYQGQDIDIITSKPHGKHDVLVTTKIKQSNGSDIQVDWRISHRSGKEQIIDVIVEGVSMALTQRSEFASIIQRGGGETAVLISHLKEQ